VTGPNAPHDHGWRALWRERPGVMRAIWGVAALLLLANGWLLAQRVLDGRESSRLRSQLTNVERERIDAALRADSNRTQVLVELARRQARIDNGLHLSVALDSGIVHLEQEGAVLLTLRAELGPEGWTHTNPRDSVRLAAPRGDRTIEDIAGDTLVMLSGGTVFYADGSTGTPRTGQVRVSPADLKLLKPNLRPGQHVYFY
jgi:hypothetical protein